MKEHVRIVTWRILLSRVLYLNKAIYIEVRTKWARETVNARLWGVLQNGETQG